MNHISRLLVSSSRSSLRRIKAVSFISIGTLSVTLATLGVSTCVWAQSRTAGASGEIISQGSAPFTETFEEIQKRDAPNQKAIRSGKWLPYSERVVENIFSDDFEREAGIESIPGVDAIPYSFSVVPFLGAIDPGAHFIPIAKQQTDAVNKKTVGDAVIGRDAPQTLGIVGIDGLKLNTTAGYIPPDTQGAVGPNHAMIFVNASLAIYNKSNGSFVAGSQVSLDSFFAVTSGGINYPQGGSYDPRVVYDRRSGRWFATDMEDGVNGSGDNNHVILAVSRTSNPTGTWDKYVIPVGAVGYFTDYSTLGVDDNGVYIGATLFPNASGSTSEKLIATPKANLIAASPSIGAITAFPGITDAFGSPHPALNLDGSANGLAWFVYSSGTNSGIRCRSLAWSGGVPTLTPAPGVSGTNVTTPAFGTPINAPANGSAAAGAGLAINVGDKRVQMAVIRNNQLWTARNIGVNATGGSTSVDRTACEWISLNVSSATATLTQSGRIFDNAASSPRFYYYPSITVSGQGHVAIGFSGSKSTEFVAAYTAGRLATDPLNTLQGILTVKPGNGAYSLDYGSGRNRWGDYSYTAVDPNDDQTIWSFQEYAQAANNWGVWGQQLMAPAPSFAARTTTYSGQGQQGQSNVSFEVAGTGFFDPGTTTPAFTNRLTASLSGTGISNVRAVYLSSTLVGVQCDIAAGATLGARSLTLTNPDGQSIVLASALNVVAAAPAQLTITKSLARVGSTIQATFTITNPAGSGTTFSTTRLNTSSIVVSGTTTNTTTTLPITVGTGTLAPGASASVVVSFPASVGTAGTAATISIAGTHSTGSFGGSYRVTLP